MTAVKHARWLAATVAGLLAGIALTALAYLAVPAHAAQLRSVRSQCPRLPHDAYAACAEPTLHGLTTWTARGLVAGAVLVLAACALHPWSTRRRRDLVALDNDTAPELRAELAALAAPARPPTWLLAPYAYTEKGQAFGLPWHPYIGIDVGLGILYRTDRPRFRAIVGRELTRLRDRATATWYLAAGCLLTIVSALPVVAPGSSPVSSIDECLPGYWAVAPHLQLMLLNDATVALVANRGAIWSFTSDGTATLYLGEQTIRTIPYAGKGTISWRMTADKGQLTLTDPTVRATLAPPRGTARTPDAGDYVLPPTYTCTRSTTTTMADEYAVVLHRVGTPPS